MRRLVPLALALGALACGGGLQRNSGLDALLQVSGAQFFPGAFPKDGGGPQVGSLRSLTQDLRVGQTNRPLSGSVGADSASVALGLAGDSGWWLVPAGGADPILADQLSFDVTLGFSRFITAGSHDVLVAAANAAGHFGPARAINFNFLDLDAPPDAELRVALTWDVDADLDLHVVEPDGKEVWARKISTYEPPVVGPVDQQAAEAAGHLDFDSNAMCHLDGRRAENVLYGHGAPSGRYLVRVDTFSLCGEAAARWRVEVTYRGAVLATQTGTSLPESTRFPHERGAGVLAVDFTVP